MKLEEYILKRKKEDGINEYDLDKRPENIRICVNYIFEYFNNYIDTKPADEKTILHDRKIDYFRKSISNYNTEVKEWLVSMYSSYGKYMHRQLMNLITDIYFLLYNTEAEFRALSYDIYPKAVKKFKFLEGQSEIIYQFIKEAHKIRNNIINFSDIYISESINEWIEETYKKYEVNIYNFCYEYVESYFETPEKWPIGHKKKSRYYDQQSGYTYKHDSCLIWEYDVRQKSNLFGLDTLYRNMPKKDFIKGKKQEFEAVLMYCWLHWFAGDEDNYWDEYSKIVLLPEGEIIGKEKKD
jgi:hypothetical protein